MEAGLIKPDKFETETDSEWASRIAFRVKATEAANELAKQLGKSAGLLRIETLKAMLGEPN